MDFIAHRQRKPPHAMIEQPRDRLASFTRMERWQARQFSKSTIMEASGSYTVFPIAWVRSSLKRRADAPRQGREGAPDARLEILPSFVRGLGGIKVGQEIVILTWLHEAERDVLEVHPRDDQRILLTGVFATRSPDRPNPVGLHRVKVLRIANGRVLDVQGLEAIDGTPVIDIKPVLD